MFSHSKSFYIRNASQLVYFNSYNRNICQFTQNIQILLCFWSNIIYFFHVCWFSALLNIWTNGFSFSFFSFSFICGPTIISESKISKFFHSIQNFYLKKVEFFFLDFRFGFLLKMKLKIVSQFYRLNASESKWDEIKCLHFI